jgi:predicted nucleic acid-binding protein
VSKKTKTGFQLVLIDTTPLYALADRQDADHDRALKVFKRLSLEGNVTLQIPAPVVFELHRLRLYRKPFEPGTALLEIKQIVQRFPIAHPEPTDFDVALEQLGRFPDQRITLADGVTASMAKRLEARVFTFDRHFALLGAALV